MLTHHRQVVYLTTKLPKTGPMLKPESSAKMYIDVKKLLIRPGYQMSLTMPDVMLASVAVHDPVMIRTTIKVAKL